MKKETFNAGSTPVEPVRYGGVVMLDKASFAAIPDNTRQRDTESRARRAQHLRKLHPSHQKVNIARFPDGRLMKLDGHSRSFLWMSGQVPAPEVIYADVWDCQTEEDAKDLYMTFDSQDAVENSMDRIFGGLKEKGIKFQSEFMQSGRFSAAMRIADETLYGWKKYHSVRGQAFYDMLFNWLPELTLLDECRPSRKKFIAPVMAAALLTFRRHGADANAFWSTYSAGKGTKVDGEMDAVQAFQERIYRLTRDGKTAGRDNHAAIIRVAISAFEAFREDRFYTGSAIKSLGENRFSWWLDRAKKFHAGRPLPKDRT
ncbi:hypothetical protein ELH77_18995 [Rhizobium ruizarguesonis]|uniref:hypothetical protein n=1 Tax=Rhizobium ruizarguesonis TaxID=2081791 RepID=UPI001031F367|nr:hypothetical protein [Rhizobium ruizarguesonis]TAZ20694.1 hypothetical protein ELH77_18995 [Rhizobium ruizarguesonis]